jgi:demethylmenaquinone methyltransferase/2-methoxy-6-polyprenyl-1,4-benzoquinol methylase
VDHQVLFFAVLKDRRSKIGSSKKDIWLSGDQPQPRDAGGEKPYFGYEQVSEDEKTRRVIRHFDSVAGRYDFMNTLLSFGIHHLWKREAVRMMGLGPGAKVLDVCGGTGDLAVLASRYAGPGGRLTIFDLNRAMMNAGRKKVLETASSPVDYVQGNAEKMPFPDNAFDAAMVGYGIRNVTRMEKGFEEMYRVLRPGGRMMCLEFSKPVWPVFRWLYDIYSFRIMPFLGDLITGSRGAYTHLPESIRTFPLPDALSAMMEGIGFMNVSYRRQTNGISVVHVGEKQKNS